MPRNRAASETLVDSVSINLFNTMPIFRKRLLHLDVIQHEFDMPLSHVQVLSMLDEYGTLNVSEISKRLGIAKPNITPLIDRLTTDGYVERVRDAQDRRMVNVSIQPEGKSLLAQIRGRMRDLVAQWADNLSVTELRTLNDSLSNVSRILGESLQGK